VVKKGRVVVGLASLGKWRGRGIWLEETGEKPPQLM